MNLGVLAKFDSIAHKINHDLLKSIRVLVDVIILNIYKLLEFDFFEFGNIFK